MPLKHRTARLGLIALATLFPTLAFAHVGIASTHGFTHGFLHPIGGIDHVFAMVAVGVFATNLGERALSAVPLSFMGCMLLGCAIGVLGFPLPLVETGIALSLVVLGAAVAMRWDLPVVAATAIVGLFAVFHGHAHGTEMPPGASGVSYALGFVIATGLLHFAGIGLALALGGLRNFRRVARFGRAAIAIVGVALLGAP